MNSSVNEVMSKLTWYNKTFLAIKHDDALTEGGRARQYENLSKSYQLYGDTVYQTFDAAWRELRGEFDALSRARRAASQRAEDAWSYERLRYYSEQARADISRSMSLPELEKHLRSIVASGSREQARAYLESTSAVLTRYHSVVGAGSLVAWMEQASRELTTPSEFAKLDEREHELIMRAVELRDKTQAAANMHPQSGAGELLRLVHIGMKPDSVSGKYYYELNFTDESTLTAPSKPEPITV